MLLILSIVFMCVLIAFQKDYKFGDNKKDQWLITGILIIFSYINSYRMTILVIVYLLFFLPFVLLYFLVSEFVYYACCVCCWIDRKSFSKAKLRLKKNLLRNTIKLLAGSLDLFHLFFCFQNGMPLCVDRIQPLMDFVGLLKDVGLIFLTISIGVFLETKRISGGNIAPVVCFFVQCLPLAVMLVVNAIRFKRTRKVSARVRDVFSEEDNVKVRVFYEDLIGAKECPFDDDCDNTEPKHRVKYHKREDVFKLEMFDENDNIVVGFHQTSLDNVKNIIKSTIRPSSEGWIGSGIYFATNFAATENKANNKGATLVAKIQLGKVEELRRKPTSRSANKIAEGCNSRYLHHDSPKYDEFIIRDATQIKEYVVVVTKNAVKEYRDRFTKIW